MDFVVSSLDSLRLRRPSRVVSMPPRGKKIAAKAAPKPVVAHQATAAQAQPVAVNGKADNRALPKKESELFRQVLKLYEEKAFSVGLKTVEEILSAFPEHGGESYQL